MIDATSSFSSFFASSRLCVRSFPGLAPQAQANGATGLLRNGATAR